LVAPLVGGSAAEDERMRRKRNINFGFLPAHPTRADLLKSRREFRASVRRKTQEIRDEYRRLRKSARSGRTASTRKLEALFHEVYGPQENPRVLLGMSATQLAAIQKLIGGNMAQKKKRKKRNGRKGKMPAGLKAYWAKKSAAKAKRRNPKRRRRARRKPRPRVRWRTRMVINYRTRTVKVYPKRRRRRKSNPRHSRRTPVVNLGSGFTPKQIKKVGRLVARAMGRRAKFGKR